MKKELQIRFIAIFIALGLLLPMGLSLSHALHDHQNQICTASGENHIHAESLDCDHQHYFMHQGLMVFEHEKDPSVNLAKELKKKGNLQGPISNIVQHIALRGPPSIDVL